MKKFITAVILIVAGKLAFGQYQHLDSVYYFTPSIIPGVKSLRSIDSPFTSTTYWEVARDSSDQQKLRVTIFHNNKAVQDGIYKLSEIDTAYAHVINLDGKPNQKKPTRLNLIYLREGYWNSYKGKTKKSVYYHRGKALKEKGL